MNPRPNRQAPRAATARSRARGGHSAPALALANESSGPVTVQTIAARLGLSKSTVAAALREHSLHAPETVAKVKAMAAALGYRPSPFITATVMRVRQTRCAVARGTTLGYLTDVPRRELLNPDCPTHEGYVGARERAHSLGFGIDLIEYFDPGMPWARLRNVIRSRGILGFIIAPHTQPQIELDLGWEEFAIVCIGFSVVSPRFDRVGYDHHEAIVEVCKRMSNRGHRRMGLVMSDDFDARVLHVTRAGFLRWQCDHDGEALPILILPAGGGLDSLETWYRRHRPDCIIAPGIDVVKKLAAFGVSVPRDVVVTTTMRMSGREELGGFDISLRTLARSAVDLLAAKLYHNERGIPAMRQTVLVLGEYFDAAAHIKHDVIRN